MRKVTEQGKESRTTFRISGAIESKWREVEIAPYMVTSDGSSLCFHAECASGVRRVVKVELSGLSPWEVKKIREQAQAHIQRNLDYWKAVLS